MTKRTAGLLAALLLLPLRAAAGAAEELFGAGGAAQVPAPPAPEAAAGEYFLPDETVAEEPPSLPETVPLARVKAAAGPADFSFDPDGIIPPGLRDRAYEHYKSLYGQFGNTRSLAVIDFSAHSSRARFYIADTVSGKVKVYHVAHGSGSDADHDGYATVFSNKPDSNASSLGLYLTGELYNGKHGRSMRLHGLSETNSRAYERAVVIHAADYVSDSDIKPGRSWGCPAVSKASLNEVLAALQGGALIYAGLSR